MPLPRALAALCAAIVLSLPSAPPALAQGVPGIAPRAAEAATGAGDAADGEGTAGEAGAGEAGAGEAGPDAPAAGGADGGGGDGAARAERLRALAALLRDPAAREVLIADLEAAPGAAPGAATAPAPAPQAEAPSFGAGPGPAAAILAGEEMVVRRLALYAQETLEELAESWTEFVNGLGATQRRLAALVRGENPDQLFAVARGLASVFAVTVGAWMLLWRALRPVVRALGNGAAAGRPLVAMLRAGLAFGVDLLAVMLAWGIGYALAFLAFPPLGTMTLNQSLYLNAFLMVGAIRTAVAAVLAPRGDRLRFAPLTDGAARYWNGRLGGLAALLGYGLMLVEPVVSANVSVFTGRAVQVVVYGLALLWAMALVIRHRRAPLLWLRTRAAGEGGDVTLRILGYGALVWHWPALLWLVSLFVVAVSRSGAVGPMLTVSAQVAGVLVAGAALSALMAKGARQGVRFPATVTETLPLLETRVNAFLLRFLGVMRFIIFVLAVALSLRLAGVIDLRGALVRQLGYDLVPTIADIAVTAVLAFAVWLAVASWVDWKLNPSGAVAPDPREQTLLTLLRNAMTIVVVVVAGMSILSSLGLDVAPLIASAGVVGLAIGFGAQRLVQDVITGIFIQFENAINVGDVVTVGGISGVVEKLTIRSVSLRDLSGVFHVIPFSSVDMVSNFNRGFAFHVAELGIAYDSDIETAKAAVHRAFDDVKADPAFGSQIIGPLDWHGVTAFLDSSVTLRARIRTRAGAQWAVGRAFNERVKRRFDDAGIEIPFPQRTLWVRTPPGATEHPAVPATAPTAAPPAESPGMPASSAAQ